jgi:outer membrane protein OmpA-like peptidoglycan-associated protein
MKLNSLAALLPMLAIPALSASNQDGMIGVGKTHSAQTLTEGRLQISAYSHVIDDDRQLEDVVVNRDGVTQKPSYFLLANSYLNLAYGLSNNWDAALSLPFYYEEVVTSQRNEKGTALGDLKLLFKYRAPWGGDSAAWNMSFLFGASAPTGQKGVGLIPRQMEYIPLDSYNYDDGSPSFGTGMTQFQVGAALTGDFSRTASQIPILWHLNGGVRKVGVEFGSKRNVDDVLSASTALEFNLSPYFGLYSELYHEARFNQVWESEQFETDPTTITLAAVGTTPVGLQFQAGVVFGILRDGSTSVTHYNEDGDALEQYGYKATVPVSMAFGVSWNGQVAKRDLDKDGVPNSQDKCPADAEDKDGFQDEDGCPDPDNDVDGILDLSDKCPIQAEDRDGFQDEDGCADPDNDADGILDLSDKCPLEAGTGDAGGCPNRDLDNDGIANDLDKCPTEAEDKDGFQDQDGCVDTDNDADAIMDGLDKCPNEAEVVNAFQDQDGCPDEVIKKGEKLILKGVFFKTASAELTPESLPTLDKLAEQLTTFPEVKLEVQGHTDNVGKAAVNKRLSGKRAQSVVDYLVSKGIAKERLKAFGYGPAKPIGDNKTEEGRAMNRRVELLRND